MARRTLAFSLVAVAIAFIVLASGCQTSSTEGTSAKSRSGSKTAGPLVVYSGRKEKLFLPVVERFEKKTGIDVQLKQGATAELAATILEEQPNPRADIFLSQEAGFLDRLRREGALLPYKPKNFDLVEEDFRADDGSWIGVSGRARVIMYNKNLVKPADLPDSVFDLTDPRWKGKIAMASSREASVVGWISSLRLLKGDNFTREFLKELVENQITVLENHTLVRKAVGKGEFSLGYVNHYYYHLELKERAPVGVIYPDQGDDEVGVLVNVGGMGILKGAKHVEAAKEFLDFVTDPEAQDLFARNNFEYPTIPSVKPVDALPLDRFKRSPVKLEQLGAEVDKSLDMLEEQGIR